MSYYQKLNLTQAQIFILDRFVYGGSYRYSQDMRILKHLIEKYDAESRTETLSEYIYRKMNDPKKYKKLVEKVEKEIEKERERTFSFGAAKGASANILTSSYCVAPPDAMMRKAKSNFNMSMSMGPSASVQMDGMTPESMPVINNISEEMSIQNIENLATDNYEHIEENTPSNPMISPTSTFRPTYNTAAASIVLDNFKDGRRVKTDMVRTEELLNYLKYDLIQPQKDEMFALTKELVEHKGEHYLFFGVQGTNVIPTRQNIVLLLDVSGSMGSKAERTQKIIFTILDKLNDGDVVSLVTYSNTDHLVIESLTVDKKTIVDKFIRVLLTEVTITGCTYGSAGINKAYELVEQNKIADGINRVILITDGDLNFGVTEKGGLIDLIKEKKETGAYLSVIGTGIYNLQDDKMEALAKNGNGNYFVTNSDWDIEKCVLNQYNSLVYPIATDVKAQVEFNPKFVKSYKLVGYENRMLKHEDFKNDDVIAEPFGSDSYCVALYKVELQNMAMDDDDAFKYQTRVLKDSDEIATLKLRYRKSGEAKVSEMVFPVGFEVLSMTENAKRAIRCYHYAEDLRRTGSADKNFVNFMKGKN